MKQEKQDKKELIFDALEELMVTVPYAEISVEAIAKKAGIGKGSIYYYFKSKDEILYEVIERSYRRITRDYFETIRNLPEMSAIEKIKRLFISTVKKEFSKTERNMLTELHILDDRDIHYKMKTIAIQEISPILTELLKEGVAEGSIRTQTPRESAEIIVAVMTLFLDETIFTDSSESVLNKLKILSNVLETCLCTEKGSFDFLFEPRTFSE